MHVSLTPVLEDRIKAEVDGGFYNNASGLIREALSFMETHDKWINEIKLARLRDQLKPGIDQLDHGEGIGIESRAALDELFEDVMKSHFSMPVYNQPCSILSSNAALDKHHSHTAWNT
jgi:antitoxin ParD1/3/4